jgi:hypothetical protein
VRTLLFCFNLLWILIIGSTCYASETYLRENRVAYVSKVLQAFGKTKIHDIHNTYSYINVVERNNCRSNLSDLKAECLLSFAKENCTEAGSVESKDNCELYSDIIIVNKLSENVFVTRSERYRMLKNSSKDFRTAMAGRLQQEYSRLVTHFSLTEGSDCDNEDFECLGKGLDQFCLDYTNRESLSWQYCMSASLWFIGTSKDD